jgi:hypothetical protein
VPHTKVWYRLFWLWQYGSSLILNCCILLLVTPWLNYPYRPLEKRNWYKYCDYRETKKPDHNLVL